MKQTAKILLVDDEPGMLRYIRTLLEVDDYKVETATTGEEAVQKVEKGLQPDLVLLDVLMPGIDGLQTLEQLRQKQPGLKVVMLSCVADTRKVVQAMKLGAQDYLTKPFQKAELDSVIDLSLGQGKQVSGEVEELADDVFFIAASPAMKKIRSQAALVANVDIPVLLLGESGTGKEVLARLIHKLSPRAHRTFLKVNCAAVPGELLESELFGYEPGAFTGATHANALSPGSRYRYSVDPAAFFTGPASLRTPSSGTVSASVSRYCTLRRLQICGSTSRRSAINSS